jgi:hypothetical protein
MRPFKLHLAVFLSTLTLFSCETPTPSPPYCRSQGNVETVGSSAACLILVQDKVLMLRDRQSDHLFLPNVVPKDGETAQCAAHRATWEKTGLNVLVSMPLANTPAGGSIFLCTEQAGLNQMPDIIDAPFWGQDEVRNLEKIAPFELNADELQFKDNLIPLRDAFITAQHQLKRSDTAKPSQPD